MRLHAGTLSAFIMLSPLAAASGAEPVQGELALGAGIATPLGAAQRGSPLSNEVGLVFPISLGIGARLLGLVYAGGEAMIAPAVIGDTPPPNDLCHEAARVGSRCSAGMQRLSGVVGVHPLPGATWDPWFRLGLGYEWLRFAGRVRVFEDTDPNRPPTAPGDFSYALEGWAFQTRAGVDYALPRMVRVGGYLAFDLGRYTRRNVDESGTHPRIPVSDGALDEPALHFWVGAGVRVALIVPD